MVLGISPTKSSSSSTDATEAYNNKQQQRSKSKSVASLMTCCTAPEGMDGFPGGIGEEDYDNDSFVSPTLPMETDGVVGRRIGAKEHSNKNNTTNDGFASAVKKQQQRNRFTSSPLIERDSSLVREQSGLLSLLSSGTFNETSPRGIQNYNKSSNGGDYSNPITMRRNQTPPTPSMVTSSSPPRSARRKHQLHQQQQHYSPPTKHNSGSKNQPPPASPALELSMARKSANAMVRRQHNVGTTAVSSSSSSSSPVRYHNVAETVAALTIESPTKKARQQDDDDDDNDGATCYDTSPSASARGATTTSSFPSILQPNLSIEESYSAADTLIPHPPQKQNTHHPTTTTTTTIVPQTSSFSSTEMMATTCEYKKNIVIWKHYSKAVLDSKHEGHLHHSTESLLWNNQNDGGGGGKGNNNSINDELNMSYKFPRMYLQNPSELNVEVLKREAWWYKLQCGVESTLGHVRSESIKQQVLMQGGGGGGGGGKQQSHHHHHQQQHRDSDASISSSSKSTKSSFSKSPKSTTSNKTIHSNNTNGEEFSPAAQPTNVWSEPSASTMKVRGPTYAQDGIKITSEESMFAVLGVDNFVKDKGGGGGGENNTCKSGTSSFMERWKSVCADVGVETVPFLLVFNFIVPWGNFQFYLIRPDADNGPYSTDHADRPSEKAWKSFLEGNTEYRNTVLKFIPRIIAGPWMVKKMVGSTPAIIGQKLPVSYSGSIEENYLEVSLDVTQGPALGNTIANTVVGKADVVTVDLGFVLEGQDADGTLPEQMLGLVRLHHFDMKKAFTHAKWKEELRWRSQSC